MVRFQVFKLVAETQKHFHLDDYINKTLLVVKYRLINVLVVCSSFTHHCNTFGRSRPNQHRLVLHMYGKVTTPRICLTATVHQVESLVGDSSKIKQLVEDVLQPACEDVKFRTVTGINSLRTLISLHQEHVRSSTAPKLPINRDQTTEKSSLSAVSDFSPTDKLQPRPPTSTAAHYPALSPRLTQSPRCSKRGTTPLCRLRTPCPSVSKLFEDDLVLMERHKSLSLYCELFEKCNSKLQEMLTILTQKVLVPLQPFCKSAPNRFVL